MTKFHLFMYFSVLSIGWVLGIAGLFKVNEQLGLAALLYLASTWIKAYGTGKDDNEEKYRELKEKLIREGSLKE